MGDHFFTGLNFRLDLLLLLVRHHIFVAYHQNWLILFTVRHPSPGHGVAKQLISLKIFALELSLSPRLQFMGSQLSEEQLEIPIFVY